MRLALKKSTVRPPRRGGFVLLEVLLALMILGIAVSAFMRSFTQSLAAAKRMDIQTQAGYLADRLMNQMEITPPAEGNTEGDFGDDYKNYHYKVTMDYEDPDYGKLDGDDNIEQFIPMRRVNIEIDYDDGVNPSYQVINMDTAIIGFEKFTFNSKQSYANYGNSN